MIFIGYRHDDGGYAWSVYQHLRLYFDEKAIFIDHKGLASGREFRPELEKAIEGCTVFLTVIGPHWLSEQNLARLADERDVTRSEIRTALQLGKPVLPVHCREEKFPVKTTLPADIAALCDFQCHHLPDSEHYSALNRLIDQLRDVHHLQPRYRPPQGVSQAYHLGGQVLSAYFADPVDALGRLGRMLGEGGEAAVVGQATLQGMGGVGKTQLALKYCATNRQQYAGIWWFRAASLVQLQQDCQYFCAVNGVRVLEGEDPHRAVARYLQQQPRWILVYDNAEAEYGEQQQHLRPFLPSGDHHLIITARSPELGEGSQLLPLDVWTPEEALIFLRKRLPAVADDELSRLAKTLGGLPLALEQACAYLKKTGSGVGVYCAAIADLVTNAGLLDRKAAKDNGYPYSVLLSLSLSFDSLSPAAQELLRLCAWGAPEPIVERLFRDPALLLATAKRGEIEIEDDAQRSEITTLLPGELQRVAADDFLWVETVAELTGYALAQRPSIDLTPLGAKEKESVPALLLHRLTQAVVIHRLSDPIVDAPALTKLVQYVFPDDITSTTGWPLAQTLSSHVLRLEEHLATGHIPHRPLSWLLDRLASYMLNGPALYQESLGIYKRALSLVENILGPDHPDTLASMSNMAGNLYAMGEHKGALAYEEQVLKRSKEKLGPDHPNTLTSMNNLALTLRAIGEHKGALAYAEQGLKLSKEKLGPDHPNTLASMAVLAGILYAMGDHKGALVNQEQVLKCIIEKLGSDHPDTLTSMCNLAQTLKAMGDHKGALAYEEQVLKRRAEKLGPDHPATLTSMNNLAHTLYVIGDHKGALAYAEQVLKGRTEKLGPDHPNTLTSMNNLAQTLSARGDHKGALAYQEQVLKSMTERLGQDHPHTLTSMGNMAGTLYAMGDHKGALVNQEQVLKCIIEKLGLNHTSTTISAWNLFKTLDAMGDHPAAHAVIDQHLKWMLAEDVVLLSGDQRQIRKMLIKIVEGGCYGSDTVWGN